MVQHVVIGIILNAEQEVLIAQRAAHQEKPGFWEFPGGKVEENETPFEALQREFKEEINISVTVADPWMKVTYEYPHKSVLLDVWMITEFTGKPMGAEGQPIRWVKKAALTELEFPEGNRPVIKKLIAILS
jgi:8-oxo-dGTP diphosphatase